MSDRPDDAFWGRSAGEQWDRTHDTEFEQPGYGSAAGESSLGSGALQSSWQYPETDSSAGDPDADGSGSQAAQSPYPAPGQQEAAEPQWPSDPEPASDAVPNYPGRHPDPGSGYPMQQWPGASEPGYSQASPPGGPVAPYPTDPRYGGSAYVPPTNPYATSGNPYRAPRRTTNGLALGCMGAFVVGFLLFAITIFVSMRGITHNLPVPQSTSTQPHQVSIKVTTNVSTEVNYDLGSGTTLQTVTKSWSKTATVVGSQVIYISAQPSGTAKADTVISCTITIDGAEADTQQGKGAGALASCTAPTE